MKHDIICDQLASIKSLRDALHLLQDHTFSHALSLISFEQSNAFLVCLAGLPITQKTNVIEGLGWLMPLTAPILLQCLNNPDVLKDIEAPMLQSSIANVIEAFRQLATELAGENLSDHQAHLQTEVEKLEQALDAIDEEQMKTRERIAELSRQEKHALQKLQHCQEETETLKKDVAQYEQRLASIEESIRKKSDEMDGLKAEIESINNKQIQQKQHLEDRLKTVNSMKERLEYLKGNQLNQEIFSELDSAIQKAEDALPPIPDDETCRVVDAVSQEAEQ